MSAKRKTTDECDHVNKHSYGIDGNPDNLKCTLGKGHRGDHVALHLERGTQFSTELQETSAFVYMRACKKCKVFVEGKKSYCEKCFEPFPEKTPHYYEGEIEVHWNAMAGIPASEITPKSPGIEVINSDQMFPEIQQQRQQELEQRSEELVDKLVILEERVEGKLKELEEVSPETPPEDSSEEDEQGEN